MLTEYWAPFRAAAVEARVWVRETQRQVFQSSLETSFCCILTSLHRQVSKCEELICKALAQQIRSPEFSPINFANRQISRILPHYTNIAHNHGETPLRPFGALAISKKLLHHLATCIERATQNPQWLADKERHKIFHYHLVITQRVCNLPNTSEICC